MTKSKQLRIAGLNSARGCSREAARIFRMARRGEMEIGDMKSYVWALKMISAMIETSDFEQRIVDLEERRDAD